MIPEMTDEMGRYWDAPKLENILVDDTHALMSAEDYKKLAHYETSTPSGVYDGKMWRRSNLLCWFGPSTDPTKCSINTREILKL